ncbi:SDR family oxidoreductase [Agrobacterium rhizogenes]|nr:SDR family oxidoreductase [Rhizobium rhizogenes]
MTNFRVLIAGGAGFLGAKLCELLLDAEHVVYCLDNFQTGNIARIEHLLTRYNFSLIQQSVTEPIRGDFEHIYNLASPASPPQYQKDPIDTFKTNILGTLNLLEYATANCSKFLQASTSEVYGDPLVHPQPETYFGNVNPIGIRSCYDEGKRGAETLIYDFQRFHQTNIRVARIFNTYGPGMDISDGRVISNFIVQALTGKNITIYGDGNQTRSFCYRDDLVHGLIALMNAEDSVSEPVNLGNPDEMNLRDLADLILRLTNSDSEIVFNNAVSDDPQQRRPDVTRAAKLLDWSPKISLEEGLQKTISYFQSVCMSIGAEC